MQVFKSLYIHIPFCLSKCAYCDFFSKPVLSVPDSYVEALCNELSFRLDNDDTNIETVYIGGGTPSLLTEHQITQIFSKIYFYVKRENIKECTFEINPDDVTEKLLEVLYSFGVTRLSMGVQSFDNKVLSFCKRRADRKQIERAFSIIEKNWEGELSIDLISGLPYETECSFFEALNKVCKTKANHISLYSLTFEENTLMGKMLEEGKLNYDFDFSDSLWIKGRDFLKRNGFVQYEVSNFCKNNKVSFHNLNYWNRVSYLGCGSGGTGSFYRDDGTAFRWTNNTDIEIYIKTWKDKLCDDTSEIEEVSKLELKFEFFMMGLRKLSGVSKKHYENSFKQKFPVKAEALFKKWKNDGLAHITCLEEDVIYSLNENGILYLNRFLEELIVE